MINSVLVTGASGFVGGALLRRMLSDDKYKIKVAIRSATASLPYGVDRVYIPDITKDTDWRIALDGVSVVVHAAARNSYKTVNTKEELDAFRKVNVEGTMNLAHQAARAGVKRFIFLSSVKVNGESSVPGKPLGEGDALLPYDAYAISKMEAEQGLMEFSRNGIMDITIIRPPMVYGEGVKGNFSSLIKLVSSGVPLPLGSIINNRRSLVAVENLVDFIVTCIEHSSAVNEIFFVSDGNDLSTVALTKHIALALHTRPCLVRMPVTILKLIFWLVRKPNIANRLLGTLQVDISKAYTVLKWKPPYTVSQAMRRAISPYKAN